MFTSSQYTDACGKPAIFTRYKYVTTKRITYVNAYVVTLGLMVMVVGNRHSDRGSNL